MKNGYYSILKPLEGYKEKSDAELDEELSNLGFKQKLFEGGGGADEIVQQVIAHLSVNYFWMGVISSLFASRLEKVMSAVFNWHKRNRIKDNNIKPVINIIIYSGIRTRTPINISFYADRIYTKSEIIAKLKEARKNEK